MDYFDANDKQYLLLKEAQALEPLYFKRFFPPTEKNLYRHVVCRN